MDASSTYQKYDIVCTRILIARAVMSLTNGDRRVLLWWVALVFVGVWLCACAYLCWWLWCLAANVVLHVSTWCASSFVWVCYPGACLCD